MGWREGGRTFIFSNVLERKLTAVVLPLDDANLAKSTFAHDPQESEVVEVDCGSESDGLAGAAKMADLAMAAGVRWDGAP